MACRVIDHARAGRTIRIVRAEVRRSDARAKTRRVANDRSSVRSPEANRERAADTTSAPTRPTTASAELTRGIIRPGRD